MPVLSGSAQSRMTAYGIPRAVGGSFAGKTENVTVTIYGPRGITDISTPTAGTTDILTPWRGRTDITTPDAGVTDL